MTDRITFTQPDTGPVAPTPEPAPDPNRPAWLPENFKTPEDMAKSWNDQRAEITRLQQAAKKPGEAPAPSDPAREQNPSDTPSQGQNDPAREQKADQQSETDKQDDAAKKVAQSAGVDLTSYQEEYNTTGDVSPESRKKLAEGLKSVLGEDAEQIVNDFIEAKKVVHQNDLKLYMDEAGGEDSYKAMIAWAAESLPDADKHAFNKQVNSGDRSATLLAISGLRARYEAANGRAPRLHKAGAGLATDAAPFRSSAEMRQAMSDPRYKTDPAYRDSVAARLRNSNF